jgi:hypothetical protein
MLEAALLGQGPQRLQVARRYICRCLDLDRGVVADEEIDLEAGR